MKILVLGGGNSNEREVSLRSAAAVRRGLKELGYEVAQIDPADGHQAVVAAAASADIVFPILHGAGGEDGEIQALLDHCGKPYLGSDVDASEQAFDKVITKELMLGAGLPTAPFSVVTAGSIDHSKLIERPFVLKPVRGGSSIDVAIERHLPDQLPTFRQLFERHHEMLLEELIEGVELTVAVLDNTALPVIEIVPPSGKEFDYDNKYNGATAELCPPRNVPEAVQMEARRMAEVVHKLVGARHLSRTDMIMRADWTLVLLEINTMPGLTDQSLFPKAAATAGLDWPALMSRFVELTTKK